MPRRRKAAPIKVTKADGTVEIRTQGSFQRTPYWRTPEWRAIRRAALERDGWRCTSCGDTNRLEAHHLTYVRYGRERLSDLRILCQRCHATEHQWINRWRAARA